MIDLDNPQIYRDLDPQNMLARIRELPQQCNQAWQKALSFPLPSRYTSVNKIVLLGMGGSAIGGALLGSLAHCQGRVPVFIHRDYDLPTFVDAQTLVIASSYSGETEETLSAFSRALATKAKRLVITTGGRLGDMAREQGVPLLAVEYDAPPRAALGYLFLPMVGILQRLGLCSDQSGEVAQTIKVMEALLASLDKEVPQERNPAKRLAQRLFGRLPIIYGAGILSEVARRWKTQINENSKAWAFFEVFPELNHNAVVGYSFPSEMASRVLVILLRSSLFHPRILRRYEVTSQLLAQAGVEYETVEAQGPGPLSHMLSALLFGDLVSYYLALLYQTDPTPVESIDYLKRQLAQT